MKKLNQFILIIIFSFQQTAFADPKQAIHPVPKNPKFLQKNRLPYFKNSITLPPKAMSTTQKRDAKLLFDFQKSTTATDCSRAESEVYVSLSSFYGAPNGNLSKKEVEALTPIFEQIRNDADYYIQLLKKEFPRKRPFQYLAGLNPCVPKEATGAYPSGHATIAKLYALILKDLFPDRAFQFESRSQMIATDRILAGMHHPSDIEAGKQLSEELYRDHKNVSEFQFVLKNEIKKLKVE